MSRPKSQGVPRHKTKAYSAPVADHVWFRRVARDAARQKPRVGEGQFLIQIIRGHYENQKLLADIRRGVVGDNGKPS